MGWGGPRFEHHTTNQYNNFTEFVRREDAARVKAILQRDQQQQQQSAVQSLEFQGEAIRRYADAQKDPYPTKIAKDGNGKPQRQSPTFKATHPCGLGTLERGQGPQKVARSSHLRRLAQPKKLPEGVHGKHMYGRCMYPCGNVVKFPIGRNGACYNPGVDRDRIVPERFSMDVTPPWVGSFSTHRISPEDAWERAQDAYYGNSILPKTGVAQVVEEASLRQFKASDREGLYYNNEEAAAQCDVAATNPKKFNGVINVGDDVNDTPSVFSHALSNEPISNTGIKHIATSPCSTKGEVMEYLRTLTLPKTEVQSGKVLPFGSVLRSTKEWTLPELTYHVLMLQKDCVAKCKERTI
ncbi:unnamed protein product [Phytomonas sp. Hart1]|nr:unnamed protein product [Phytomonas sp. Hart1]|eukprot:CCW65931.1 unnamed protein product [Phytomonas sp. isolate Hart1]